MRLLLRGANGLHAAVNPQSGANGAQRHDPSSVGVYAMNFWTGFHLSEAFMRCLLEEAFGRFHQARREEEADLVLTSVFTHAEPRFPHKTVAVIWENQRPDYRGYDRSLSFDHDDHGGRNLRLPLWHAEIGWGGRNRQRAARVLGHGYEAPVELETLMSPREPPRAFPGGFCCFVARNSYGHRAAAVQALSRIAPVDVHGWVDGRPLLKSKYELLPGYRFNLCFENSSAPGYHTEKPVQAWAGGCIPLYWSDPGYGCDFNPRAMINLADFDSLDAFVDHVAEVDASPARLAEIYSQPLLTTAPSLAPAAAFLRQAAGR